MEILLFSLGTDEIFGINVFKVREVCRTPKITASPNVPAGMEGFISLRGSIHPVLDLTHTMALASTPSEVGRFMLVAEFSKRTIGFLVHDVDRIIRVDWEEVRAPGPSVTGDHNFITALTLRPDGRLISILDVESLLAHVFGEPPLSNVEPLDSDCEHNIFFVDDSAVARKRIAATLDALGVRHKCAFNGQEAWNRLIAIATHCQQFGLSLRDELDLILVDAEMPEMDGYVLTRHIKADHRFKGIPVVMHSSLSSEANRAMGKSVGVDAYVAKFDGEALASALRPLLV